MRRLPICFFFQPGFFWGRKQASRQQEVSVWRRENFHLLSHFKLPFFALSLSTLVVCSGISGLLVRQSHCLYQSLGFPLPLLSPSTMKCRTSTVYLIFCRGLAGKGHSCISLDHMAAAEWSWSHCHGCRRLLQSEPTPLNAVVTTT